MNKRLKFFISVLLAFAVSIGAFCVPASSFETDVEETSTSVMFLYNVDTDTVVYSKNPDNKWYAGNLSELTTFLVASDLIKNPKDEEITIEKSFVDALPYSDGCLKPFIGNTLTARDLMAIMLLTSGSDAANVLGHIASGGDREAFVEAMNQKADELGCQTTHYVSCGYDNTSSHHTTCRDLYLVYSEVRKSKFFQKLMEHKSYTITLSVDEKPEEVNLTDNIKAEEVKDKKQEEGKKKIKYTITPEASIINEASPYYFRYVNDAKYSYTEDTNAGIALTTTYRGKTYFFSGLLGLAESERNIYADAKKLTTWAYLNLSDRKTLFEDKAISGTEVKTEWGKYHVDLYPFDSAYKTLPNDFDEDKFSFSFDVPKTVKTPILSKQKIGHAKLTYDGEEFDDVDLVADSDEGLDMLSDIGRFSSYVYSRLTPHLPASETSADKTELEES